MARLMSELSDEEQNRLVAEYEQLPRGDRGKWIDSQDVTRTSFYGRRALVLRTQAPTQAPTQARTQAPTQARKRGRPVGSKNKPVAEPFVDADEATQRRLLAEYDALSSGEKAAWREAHQMTQAMTSYYRAKFAKTAPSNGEPSTALARRHEVAIEEIPAVQTRPHAPAPNGAPDPTIHLLTFDDALSVIKVRRDMYNQIYSDIINDLHRMKR